MERDWDVEVDISIPDQLYRRYVISESRAHLPYSIEIAHLRAAQDDILTRFDSIPGRTSAHEACEVCLADNGVHTLMLIIGSVRSSWNR